MDRKKVLVFFWLVMLSVSTSVSAQQIKSVPCLVTPAKPKIDTAAFTRIASAFYAYEYCYPRSFVWLRPSAAQLKAQQSGAQDLIDTARYESTDHKGQLKLWIGKTYAVSDNGPTPKQRHTLDSAFSAYLTRIRTGKDQEIGQVRLLSFCTETKDGYSAVIQAQDQYYNYWYKIILSPIPIDNSYVFKLCLFKCQRSAKGKYENMANALIAVFKASY